ncbi:right-handed parallel beta-helix repeat-containing protein [Pedobacter lithocola]|uniref:Right-handed parallel beta-helix repeat-containing protein n=1 Tax=Pedobacter lithocola TaxID=1908239 RepID=A0ABV8PFZ0_9SPHI
MRSFYYSLITLIILVSGCRKDERISTDVNTKLTISNTSILFDTIFTSIGSTTKNIKILNKNNEALNISEIKLSGGASSPFALNINGLNLSSRNNLILNGKDSLNIFVKVTINPDAKTTPFLVQDSIIISSNGNRQTIQLLAYGQNAVFINNGIINTNTTWNKNLPYIINGTINILNGATLTIQPGAKIYFHKDAEMNIEGFLNASGNYAEPILFCSDRLETIYSNEPGQWKGIYINKTGNGLIKNATIKNASVGITSDSLSVNSSSKLIVSNCVIKNMQVAAYVGNHSELLAFNNLFYNCGNYLIYAIGGGNYNIKQNTFAGFNPNFPRKTAALTFSDYLNNKAYNKLQIELANNIIWGSLNNELDIMKKTSAIVQLNIFNNLIKTSSSSYNQNGNLINSDPLFNSFSLENYNVSASSVAIKKGIDLSKDQYFTTYLSVDLNNKPRVFPSTIGCFEN